MNYTGFLFCFGGKDPYGIVTRATLTTTSLSLDWHEKNLHLDGHIEAEANNGLFAGKFNYSPADRGNPFNYTFRPYKSDNGWVLLFGTYHSDTTDEEGTWTFVLHLADHIDEANS